MSVALNVPYPRPTRPRVRSFTARHQARVAARPVLPAVLPAVLPRPSLLASGLAPTRPTAPPSTGSRAHLPTPVAPPEHAAIPVTPGNGVRPFGAPSTGVTLAPPPSAPAASAVGRGSTRRARRARGARRGPGARTRGASIVLLATVVTTVVLVGLLALGGLLVG